VPDSAGVSVVSIAAMAGVPAPWDAATEWKPLRRELGWRPFGLNAYAAAAGAEVVEPHSESSGHHEIYVVMSGRAEFTVGDRVIDAPAGTLVAISEPEMERGARAVEDGTLVLAAGGWPERPFRVSGWEWRFLAAADARRGDHAAALRLLGEGLAELPDDPWIQYDIACVRALAGDAAAAVDSLTHAIALDDRCAEAARTDADFDPVRNLEGFPAAARGPA
jgi:tetratricopeptide (TPR) repeat protein